MNEPLQLEWISTEILLRQPKEYLSHVLGIVHYGPNQVHTGLRELEIPVSLVNVPVLGHGDGICELWRSQQKVRAGSHGPISWRANESLLFLTVEIGNAEQCLHDATRDAYCALLAEITALGYPHLLRVWNHIGDINDDSTGLERYRQFNIGRLEAFMAGNWSVIDVAPPAASALGAQRNTPLALFALASHHAPLAIENPRQIRAYDYPQNYGPCPPTFSRASLIDLDGPTLFISGTASIVGHQSMHPDNCREQIRETMRNIEALLHEVSCSHGVDWELANLQFKAYLRNGADLWMFREEMDQIVGKEVNCLIIQADICRRDLLVEIEAVALPCTSTLEHHH
ncbi:hypothetical protein [Acidithiobacillus albertensis]|uniref:chorismate transformation enzyme, FkbO/Hyg5 family n=1 Tax=Acidithiobacillus albertensis TaxID=119978 RepID=UPI00094AD6AD|nr:hypothetical protein [Acidithiobacillus albertensis]